MSIGTFPDMGPWPTPQGRKLLTAEEFLEQYDGQRVELVKGLVRELPMPFFEHSIICGIFARLLGNFCEAHDLGWMGTNDGLVLLRRNPDTVFGPDVFFLSYARLPKNSPPVGLLTVLPELVAEVRSPSETWNDVFAKVTDYLAAGVVVVLVFDIESKTVSLYRANASQTTLTTADELEVPDVLPGFRVPVQRFFR